MKDITCSAPGCEKMQPNRGRYCSMHSTRLARRGTLELPAEYPGKRRPLEESFWSNVDKEGNCWLWTGAMNDKGYGQIRRGRTIFYVHRLSYEMHIGAIGDDMLIDHICRNRQCVNPSHLRPVTHKQNMENLETLSPLSESGVRGVVRSRSGKWRVQVTHYGRNYYGGVYANLDDAAEAVVKLRLQVHTHNAQDRSWKPSREAAQ